MIEQRHTRFGIARIISKRGLASRTEAERWVIEGRVSVNGRRVLDPQYPTHHDATVTIDGHAATSAERVYLALNKPRGLVTTARDEKQRATVYRCLEGLNLPWVAPVGRLDQASEGLLLLSNDPVWAAGITTPGTQQRKTYHVQIDRVPNETELRRLREGIVIDSEEPAWRALSVVLLRSGGKTAWLEVVLDEGRNRQIRRMLAEVDLGVLRLMRIAIGSVTLGTLAKGAVRALDPTEVASLRSDPNMAIR